MIDYILAILIGVSSSFVASFLFLWFLARLRPRIEISDQIAKGKSSTGKIEYRIKIIIINKTSRPIINIKAQLCLVTPSIVPGGIIREFKQIPIIPNELMELPKFNLKDIEWAGYEYRFITYEDIENLWKDDKKSYLYFRIYAVDSLSGFGKLFIKEYRNKQYSIKEGDFKFGNSFEIE